jgi:hypothetical protein
LKRTNKLIIGFLLIFFLLNVNPSNIISRTNDLQVTLTEIGEITTGSRIVDVHASGDILYILDSDQGLRIYNISNPTDLTIDFN